VLAGNGTHSVFVDKGSGVQFESNTRDGVIYDGTLNVSNLVANGLTATGADRKSASPSRPVRVHVLAMSDPGHRTGL
jgi:hypothetical protein